MTKRCLVGALLLVSLVACAPGQARLPLLRAAGAPPTTPPPTTTPPSPPPPAAPPTTVAPLPPPAAVVQTPAGVVLPVLGRQPGGWVVHTPCSNTVTVRRATPVVSPQVVLDPGHGGDETGAVGPNRLRESVLNLSVARQAEAALKSAGVTVLLTRSGDYRETLSTRTDIVTRLRPAAFVSVHHNSSPDGPHDGPGTETYYQFHSPASKRLAGLIYEEVAKTLSSYQLAWVGNVDAGAKYRLNDRGGDYYHVLREAGGVPTALAELAFIADPPEADLLARPDVQQAEGQAVARGVIRYLRTNDPGSGFVTPVPRTTPAPGGGAEGCVDPPL